MTTSASQRLLFAHVASSGQPQQRMARRQRSHRGIRTAAPDAQACTVRLLAWRLRFNGGALQLDEPHLREWAESQRLICVERCNWSARCVSCARPWFAPFQLRLIHAVSPAVECAPSLFPTSQFLTRRHWPELAPWRAAGPPIAPDSSKQLRAGVAPWRSSPRQRRTDGCPGLSRAASLLVERCPDACEVSICDHGSEPGFCMGAAASSSSRLHATANHGSPEPASIIDLSTGTTPAC